MPLHLEQQTRRVFLRNASVATVVIASGVEISHAADEQPAFDERFFALIADTHIPFSPDDVARDVNMTRNFKSIVSQILGMKTRPANLILNGDVAHSNGKPEEYQNFSECIAPLMETGMRLHLTMGNHDNRDVLYKHFAQGRLEYRPIPVKHVSVLETEFANWYMIDTLVRPGIPIGEVGYDQLRWLEQQLDKRPDKPALIVAHHNPQLVKPERGSHWMGIWDTDALLELLDAKPQVHALIYGHTHNWQHSVRGDLHLINLPATSYVFGKNNPAGWVATNLDNSGCHLTVHSIDQQHRKHGEKYSIPWR